MNSSTLYLALLLLTYAQVSSLAAISDKIRNGGFIGTVARADWRTTGDFRADSRYSNYNITAGYAYLAASDGNPGNNLNGSIYQEVEIPPGATSAWFSFWYKITSEDSSAKDKLVVSIRSNSGDELEKVKTLYGRDSSGSYAIFVENIVQYAGQTIQVHFDGYTDSSSPTTFRIDDVSLLVEVTPDTAPPDILRFYPEENSVEEGDAVKIYFRVRDSQSGIHRVVLKRNDFSDADMDPNWFPVASVVESGELVNGHFEDYPGIGRHWYGLEVFDNGGNSVNERQEGLGPDEVFIKTKDKTPPSILEFYPSATVIPTGQSVSLFYTVTDSGGSGLKAAQIIKNDYTGESTDERWDLVATEFISGDGPFAGQFTVTPSPGDHWYGLLVADVAQNSASGTEIGKGPHKVSVGSHPTTFKITTIAQNGSVELDPNLSEYPFGANVRVVAKANSGFVFSEWRDDASGVNRVTIITANRDLTVRAKFVSESLSINMRVAHTTPQVDPAFSIVPTPGYKYVIFRGDTATSIDTPVTVRTSIPDEEIIHQMKEPGKDTQYFLVEQIPDTTMKPFLNFPILNHTSTSTFVTSALDHHGVAGKKSGKILTCRSELVGIDNGFAFGYRTSDSSELERATNRKSDYYYYENFFLIAYKKSLPGESFSVPFRLKFDTGTNGDGLLFYDGHSGYDYSVGIESDIVAAADGDLVVDECGGRNNQLVIDHNNGYKTYYLHLSSWSELIQKMDNGKPLPKKVYQGDFIGHPGDVGDAKGVHLHFEVHRRSDFDNEDVIVDPYGFFATDSTIIQEPLWNFGQ